MKNFRKKSTKNLENICTYLQDQIDFLNSGENVKGSFFEKQIEEKQLMIQKIVCELDRREVSIRNAKAKQTNDAYMNHILSQIKKQ